MADNKSAVAELSMPNSFAERRFVGKKETLAYVLNDASYSLNIDDFKERYIYDVVKIDFKFLAFQNLVGTIWDTVNDTFIGVLVEKTRTRWGKFRPYLLLGEFPLTIQNADTILVVRDGKITEQGTHDELIKLGGFYSTLYNSQFS